MQVRSLIQNANVKMFVLLDKIRFNVANQLVNALLCYLVVHSESSKEGAGDFFGPRTV